MFLIAAGVDGVSGPIAASVPAKCGGLGPIRHRDIHAEQHRRDAGSLGGGKARSSHVYGGPCTVASHTNLCVCDCLHSVLVQATVAPFDFAASWSQRLTAEIQQWEETLVKEDAADLLSRVGITPKLAAVQSHDGSVRCAVCAPPRTPPPTFSRK